MHTQSTEHPVDAAAHSAMDAEVAAARLALPALNAIASQHPAWLAGYDLAETDSAGVEALLELLETAPTEFARGMVFGKLTQRAQELAMCPGDRLQ